MSGDVGTTCCGCGRSAALLVYLCRVSILSLLGVVSGSAGVRVFLVLVWGLALRAGFGAGTRVPG
eukprot:2443416-Rhodomonas_salina.1